MTLLPWRALFSIKKRWMISGTMIVQRMESRKRFTVFSLPITARMSVTRYIKKMMITPISAEIRFIFTTVPLRNRELRKQLLINQYGKAL